jgi:hypothetical protein
MYTRPTEPRSIGGVLDDGFRLWLSALSKAWPIALLGQLLMAVPLIIYWVQFGAPLGAGQTMAAMLMGSAWLSLVYGIFSIVSIGFHNAVIAQTDAASRNSGATIGESLSLGFRLLGRAFLIGVLFAIAIVVPVALLFLALLGLSVTVRFVLGVAAFFAVCYALGKVILGVVALVVEDRGAVDSLRRSWNLTAGNWWRVATILTVLVIVIVALFLFVGIIAGFVRVGMGTTAGIPGVLIQIITLLGNTLVSPLYAAVLVAIFYDLRLRKEGSDLAGRVSALAV